MDNHSIQPAFNYCKKNHIILLSISPHSSHRSPSILETVSPEHEFPVPRPAPPSYTSRFTTTKSPVQGPSNQDEEILTPVAFSDLAKAPNVASTSKPRRRQQHTTILTATPLKRVLE